MTARDLPPGVTEEDQEAAITCGDDLSIHPDSITARTPRDLHDALAMLGEPWAKSILQPGIWRPLGDKGCLFIRPDVPGSGVFELRGSGLPAGGFLGTLEAVATKAREMR